MAKLGRLGGVGFKANAPVALGQVGVKRVDPPVEPDQHLVLSVAQVHPQHRSTGLLPVAIFLFAPVGVQPDDVPHAVPKLAGQELVAGEHRMSASEVVQCRNEIHQRAVGMVPVDPGDVVVLRVGVVVAQLRAAELVALLDHWSAATEKQRREQGAHIVCASGDNLCVVAGALHAAVPRGIGRVTVAVVFTIRLVVLVVVADQVAQGEPVMHSEKIDAVVRPTPRAIEDFA